MSKIRIQFFVNITCCIWKHPILEAPPGPCLSMGGGRCELGPPRVSDGGKPARPPPPARKRKKRVYFQRWKIVSVCFGAVFFPRVSVLICLMWASPGQKSLLDSCGNETVRSLRSSPCSLFPKATVRGWAELFLRWTDDLQPCTSEPVTGRRVTLCSDDKGPGNVGRQRTV